jgi:hypothetical protein
MAGGCAPAATAGATGAAAGGGALLGAGAAEMATEGSGGLVPGGTACTGSAIEDDFDGADFVVVAMATGGCTGGAFVAFAAVRGAAGVGAASSRIGRNASAITPANASDDIHADTRLSVLSTEAIVAMLTLQVDNVRKLCVFPCRSLADERGENGIASYLEGMKVRLPVPPSNDS